MNLAGLPTLMGNLLAGILLKNAIPNGTIGYDDWAPTLEQVPNGAVGTVLEDGTIEYIYKSVRGLPDFWASDIITFGLTIIFLRGGLEIVSPGDESNATSPRRRPRAPTGAWPPYPRQPSPTAPHGASHRLECTRVVWAVLPPSPLMNR